MQHLIIFFEPLSAALLECFPIYELLFKGGRPSGCFLFSKESLLISQMTLFSLESF